MTGKLRQKTCKSDNARYEYNWNNRTTNITTISGAITNQYCYEFDVTGKRTYKKEATNEAVNILFDGNDAYKEYDSGTSEEKARYVFNDDIDTPLEVKKGNNLYYYHTDHLGSVAGLTGAGQDILNKYAYYAYGRMRSKVEAIMQPYAYTAREIIGASELYYYRSRMYSALAMRFLREDDFWKGRPKLDIDFYSRKNGIVGHDYSINFYFISENNWYPYVSRNPVQYRDPWGYTPLTAIIGAAAGGLAGAVYTAFTQEEFDAGDIIASGVIGAGAGLVAGLTVGIGAGAAASAVSDLINVKGITCNAQK